MTVETKYATYLFSYRFNGREYTIDIVAKDADEAKERLKALAWAKYDGILGGRMPAKLGFFAKTLVALRNATTAIFR